MMAPVNMRERRTDLFSVFVGHIDPDVKEDELRKLFSGCGDVRDHCILSDPDKSHLNYGFIRYATAEDCLRAVKEMNGWSLRNRKLIVDYSKDSRGRILQGKQNKTLSSTQLQILPQPPVATGQDYQPSCLDKLMNSNRVKEAILSVNSEMGQGKLKEPVKMSRIVNWIESKGGAQRFSNYADLSGASPCNNEIGVDVVSKELQNWEKDVQEGETSFTEIYLKKVKAIRESRNTFLGKELSNNSQLPSVKPSDYDRNNRPNPTAKKSVELDSIKESTTQMITLERIRRLRQGSSGFPQPTQVMSSDVDTNSSPKLSPLESGELDSPRKPVKQTSTLERIRYLQSLYKNTSKEKSEMSQNKANAEDPPITSKGEMEQRKSNGTASSKTSSYTEERYKSGPKQSNPKPTSSNTSDSDSPSSVKRGSFQLAKLGRSLKLKAQKQKETLSPGEDVRCCLSAAPRAGKLKPDTLTSDIRHCASSPEIRNGPMGFEKKSLTLMGNDDDDDDDEGFEQGWEDPYQQSNKKKCDMMASELFSQLFSGD